MLLYTTSSPSPEVACLLLFSEKNWIFDLRVGILSQFRLTMGRKQILSILKVFQGIWNFFEIFLRLCFAFWFLSITDLSKKTRFVLLTMFRYSFEIWKNYSLMESFIHFPWMLWFHHSPEIRTILQFTFHSISSRLLNLLQGKNFLVLSSSVERY